MSKSWGWLSLICSLFGSVTAARAEGMSPMGHMMGPETIWQSPATCGAMMVWDVDTGMCEGLAMAGMPMRMFMVHGNAFGVRVWEQGPRARDAWAVPDMLMTDLGTSIGDRHYLNLDLMLTAEKWLFPDQGYPLLLQIGETNAQGAPFVDAQHPHSSPIMGLTLSDTITLGSGSKDHLKLFFAPRGEATDGPIAFMHRTTGMVNPDAPLGHHIGQDVGHISSTVIGGALQLGDTRVEASVYNGTEPEPEKVDLPLGTPDSFSLRLVQNLNPHVYGMVSFARVNSPEPDHPDIAFENRYSASAYWQYAVAEGWTFDNTLVYGLVTQYDHAAFLSSFAEEFLVRGDAPRIWGRIEVLQRTGTELEIPGLADPSQPQWVAAFTVGYTHKLLGLGGASGEAVELGLGGSVTKDWLPSEFSGAYGGNPWSGKIFLQLGGMGMW